MVLHSCSLLVVYWPWFNFILLNSNISFFIDSISSGMIMIVNSVSFLVHLYSTSYMKGDPHTPRFMGYLSLFTFFMLILVSSQNYIQLFIGWEGVGLCSYLLVNFWYSRIQANKAAIKAMLVNRVGDAALILGIIFIWTYFGSVNFLSVLPTQEFKYFNIIPCLLLVGAIGKSAQIGLHMWLPDAMEGPTPVSALIHAATMVTAGVYLIIRSSPLFESSPLALILTVIVGSLTALFAASIGLAQNDIKKIIAYSTCSQLGFMVLSCGISYYSLALFHLINHAFFKALLFLAAGSVIHSFLDEQDIRKMGGINIVQPLSYVFILIGSLSLAGFPFLSGYYSKDLLLEITSKEYYIIFGAWMGLTATLLTAFYSFKLITRSFLSFQNSPKIYWKFSHENDWFLLIPLIILSIGSIFSGFILYYSTVNNIIHPTLFVINKLLPLILSVTGIVMGISLYQITKKFWTVFLNSNLKKIYQFLSSAWDFDKIVSHIVVIPIWKFGYNVTFKTFDAGILEKLGPWGSSKTFIKLSKNISLVQSGYLFNYAMLILLFCSLFIIFN
ncbi:NADH dehydrogenase subunit 5 (mitochondrion) [Rhopilema esculentum]|uniref:NADH-ubiquinone oxidoreductase chain 5 n=1 Tax=Rhopilema esculentum TaxID=499914 RepID=A0A222YTU2_9CNID|nr:NADH dehydrogenase subunit 5 [Rhopilema esculentum]ASR75172.1 NADH dehydrogenase subunit 5 [Rhopilema esculentum]